MPVSPQARREQARAASLARWAKVPPSQRQREARAAARRRWERVADPDGVLPTAERLVMAEAAKKAHYARLRMQRAQRKGQA